MGPSAQSRTLHALLKRMRFHAEMAILGAIVFSIAVLCQPVAAQPEHGPVPAAETNTRVRGVIQAVQRTLVSSEIAGRITSIRKRAGESFKKGTALVQFDCALLEAEKERATAGLKAAQVQLKFHRELAELKSIGALEVALDEARVAQKQAEVQIATVAAQHCTIYAPYNGRVVKVLASRYQSVKPQQELIEILRPWPLEIELLVPSSWLSWLKRGRTFEARIDETGEILKATVEAIGAAVEPVSKMVLVRGQLSKSTRGLTPGMGASAVFARP